MFSAHFLGGPKKNANGHSEEQKRKPPLRPSGCPYPWRRGVNYYRCAVPNAIPHLIYVFTAAECRWKERRRGLPRPSASPTPGGAISTGGCALPSSLSPSWRHDDPHRRLPVASDPVRHQGGRPRLFFNRNFFFILFFFLSESCFELAQV